MVIPNQTTPLPADRALQLRYHYVEFLTEHLSDCCRAFEGDLQEMLVFAVLGQVHMRALLDAQPDGTLAHRATPAPLGINASRIADITGIPRRTVRRKLDKLKARGWVEPSASGIWVLATRDGAASAREGSGGIDALDSRSMERVLRMAERMSRIIAGTERST
jgi:predicted transcriptional regulator